MTWPQYLRHECQLNGRVVRLEPKWAEMLLVLMLRRGHMVSNRELIEALWTGPDGGPLGIDNCLCVHRCRLIRALPGAGIVHTPGRGTTMLAPPRSIADEDIPAFVWLAA